MSEDYLHTDEPVAGVRRLVAGFHGHAFDPHRHETYAIGRTLSGAQAFRYRGSERLSRAGQCIVIHPDELHDGHAGAEDGFSYQMVYVEPWLVRRALGERGGLPFVAEVVARDHQLALLLAEIFDGSSSNPEPLAWDGHLQRLADLLLTKGDEKAAQARATASPSRIAAARELINEEFGRAISSTDLEHVTGMDRFELARSFRSFVGTSPHRYLVGRRLEAARSRILAGESPAEAAFGAGFADQSHMTRHFKARYGVTPGRFAGLAKAGRTVKAG